jgi:hypothetical protein
MKSILVESWWERGCAMRAVSVALALTSAAVIAGPVGAVALT